jgi:AAHS family 4-hydroxybenzoate transporter-like MFS transporter
VLNAQPVRLRQLVIVAVVLLTLIIDGLDIQLLSLAAPLILSEWSLPRAELGAAMAAALVGMSVGASAGGWFGDRLGRKTVLILSALVFGAATVAASLTHNATEMMIARFVSGIGFGAAQPNGIALVTEWLPQRARARAVGLLCVGTPLGGMVGAGALIWLLPLYGWRGTFVACGMLTVVMAALMIGGLPESTSYLLARGKAARVQRALHKIFGEVPNVSDVRLAAADAVLRNSSGEGIFTRANLRSNTGVWLIFFGMSFVAYALAAWAPVLLTTTGFTLTQALRASLAFNISAVTAAIVTGFLLGRMGSRALIVTTCIGTMGSVALMAAAVHVATGTALPEFLGIVLVASAGTGGCTGAAIASVYALLASSYPVSCRSSGIGFGMMMGRLGAIASTFSGGALLSVEGRGPTPFFVALALSAIVAFIGLLIVDRHIPASNRSKDRI